MRIIVRYVDSKGVQESTFEGNIATIGRGTDQVIQISDRRLPLAHSKLSITSGKLSLSATGEYRFSVNDVLTKRAVLLAGDVVSISGHTIKVLPGENDADYVIEVSVEADTAEPLRDRFTTRLWQIGMPERSFAWLLFLSIITIGLVIPVSGFFLGNDALQSLRESPLPDDGIWLTGELHQTHAFMGDDCSYCHTKAFTQTLDEDCLYCHLSVNHHFDTDKLGRDYRIGDSCGDCHKEHSANDSITRGDQEVCTVCHADLANVGFESDKLRPATDFLEDHPSFKIAMHKFDGEAWQESRVDLWDEDLWEESNLKFPHDIHLDEAGVDSVDGTVVMECADCHEPEKGGLKMKTVTMEQHCADCHQLTFDPDTPDRVVPHGSPPDLMRTLREYYAYQFISRDEPKPVAASSSIEVPQSRKVRRPGRSARTQSITDIIVETQLDNSEPMSNRAHDFIEARVANAAENLFEKQTCTICHEISKVEDAEVPWKVEPVYLSGNWMPYAEFSHNSHKNMQCDGCHEAAYSVESGEVLMPDIGSCRACHGGETADNLLQSSCITCHKFHLESQGPMGELIEIDQLEAELLEAELMEAEQMDAGQ